MCGWWDHGSPSEQGGLALSKQCFEHRSTECLLCTSTILNWLLKENNIWFSLYWRYQWTQEGQVGSSGLLSCGAGHECSVLQKQRSLGSGESG